MPASVSSADAHSVYHPNLAWALRERDKVEVNLLIEPLNKRERPGYLLNRSDQAADIIAAFGDAQLKMMLISITCR